MEIKWMLGSCGSGCLVGVTQVSPAWGPHALCEKYANTFGSNSPFHNKTKCCRCESNLEQVAEPAAGDDADARAHVGS